MDNKTILSGKDLTIGKLKQISSEQGCVRIAEKSKKRILASRKYLEDKAKNEVIYGVNTGFGPMADYIINVQQENQLQENLIKSHAVGMGDAFSIEEAKASMVVRLNTLIYGYSGIRLKVLERLEYYINHNIVPVIPRHGSVGASGDLVQLAHIALALIGDGFVFYNGKKFRTNRVLKKLNLEPIKLQAKEGLSLINGTSAMSALSALLCFDAKRIYEFTISASALGIEIIDGFGDSFCKRLQELRPHKGQIKVAQDLRRIIFRSNLIVTRRQMQKRVKMDHEDVKKIDRKVQDYYSFRCLPQILGPVYDTIKNVAKVTEVEINSVTDNPIVDFEHNKIIHGGNFHGDYISLEMDKLKIVLTRVAMLIERRINFFLHEKINNTFPPFLNLKKPGLTLGLQALQFVATSTTAECQTLAFPNYVHSISCNGDNQDIVSMGTNSALITKQVLENLWQIMTIDSIVLAQAVDYLEIKTHLSSDSKSLHKQIRRRFQKIVDDKEIIREMENLYEFIRTNVYLKIKF